MGTLPWITIMISIFGPVLFYAGLEESIGLVLVVTIIMAFGSQFYPGKDTPISGRIVPLLAIALAATPLLVPEVQAMRLKQLERRRAAETAADYRKIDDEAAILAVPLQQYFAANRAIPEFAGTRMLPHINEQGQAGLLPDPGILKPFADPFRSGEAVRWAAVRGGGVLVVSAGQDGINELPLPGLMLDGDQAHPLTSWAATGQDLRLVTYDPTNGALGLGDVTRWIGVTPDAHTQEAVLGPLYRAWDLAHKRSPWNPPPPKRGAVKETNPQSGRDSQQAEQLLRERQYLAALALAGRARSNRHPYIAQWVEADYTIDRTRGMALYHLAAYRAAADALIEYLSVRPNDAQAHFYCAAALFHGGDRANAEVHLAAASMIAPADPIGHIADQRMQELRRGGRVQFPLPDIIIQRNAAQQGRQ